jgi:hypothetical protein
MSGAVERRPNRTGKLGNYPLVDKIEVPVRSQKQEQRRHPTGSPDATADWFWEGNVTNAVANYLRGQGWAIISQADTSKRERGVDIHATRLKEELMIEVKGYPPEAIEIRTGAAKRSPQTLPCRRSTGTLMLF